MNTTERNTRLVRELAEKYGFLHCSIAKAEPLDREAERLEKWLKEQRHGTMDYMERHFDLRIDPTKLVPGAKSVVVLAFNYYHPELPQTTGSPKVSMYAYGRDYHKVIRKRVKHLLTELRNEVGEVQGRGFVDSAPVMEKAWAERSGMGWIGKHTNLINKRSGSWFFLATLITDLELDPDPPFRTDHCGSCTRCIDACPTDALEPFQIDATKCISYLTIELKESIPDAFSGRMDGWAFGCDICQQVCPWNDRAIPHAEPDLMPKEWTNMAPQDWEEITQEVFDDLFAGSAIRRTGYEGLKRNLSFLKKKSPQAGGSYE